MGCSLGITSYSGFTWGPVNKVRLFVWQTWNATCQGCRGEAVETCQSSHHTVDLGSQDWSFAMLAFRGLENSFDRKQRMLQTHGRLDWSECCYQDGQWWNKGGWAEG